jgi:A/G-specific adenine glycosylase
LRDVPEQAMLGRTEIERFREQLLAWFDRHQRELPWRRTREPYAIWISEIMLQQTRVAAAISYYERFLTRFPDFRSLANASESDLLAHWAGLGYYQRARNLQKAARLMRDAGRFPTTIEEIRSLPGIGDYTAAAIASISFNLPHAVLDGNALRVLSRVSDDATNIASDAGRKHFSGLAERLLDRDRPGAFNQAMMELGATVCRPGKPRCLACPVSDLCRGRSAGRETELPRKEKRQPKVEEQRQLFWIERRGELLVWQRPPASRLMPGFWELPERAQLPAAAIGRKLGSFRHTITVHNYLFEVVQAVPPDSFGELHWVALTDLDSRAVSTILRKARRVVEEHSMENR